MGDTTHAGRRPVPYTAEEREADAMAQRELDRIREAQAVEPRVMVERVAIEALREALALRTAEVAELRAEAKKRETAAFRRGATAMRAAVRRMIEQERRDFGYGGDMAALCWHLGEKAKTLTASTKDGEE